MADKEEYDSIHDGPTIDAAVTQAKPGGTLDSRLRLSLYTSLEQIGVTVGSETMEAIALALPDNAVLEASCGASNNGVTDGTAFPVLSGSVLKYGILRVSRIGGYDRVSFDFRLKDTASRLFVGFYSSTDGWSGWKKVYTDGSKPTADEIGAIPNTGGTINGNLAVQKNGAGRLLVENTSTGRIAILETTSGNNVNFLNYKDSSNNVYLRLLSEDQDAKKLLSIQARKDGVSGDTFYFYHTGNKPTLSELGIGNISQIAVGSYTGTGSGTNAGAPTLTFSFNPKFVFVMSLTSGDLGEYGYFLRDIGGYVQIGSSFDIPNIVWGNKTLHYYDSDYNEEYSLNSSKIKYGYVAFG